MYATRDRAKEDLFVGAWGGIGLGCVRVRPILAYIVHACGSVCVCVFYATCYKVPALRRPTLAKAQVDTPECKRQPMHAKGDPRKASPQGEALAELLLQHSKKQAKCTRDLVQTTDSIGFRTTMHDQTVRCKRFMILKCP